MRRRRGEAHDPAMPDPTRPSPAARATLLALAVLAPVVAACGGDDVSLPDAPDGGYTVEVEATETEPDVLTVQGSTNLPDGTVVEIEVWRTLQTRGGEPGHILETTPPELVVADGRFRGEVPVELSPRAPDGPDDEYVAVSPDLTVCAIVNTWDPIDERNAQPESVQDVIGANGQGLEGSDGAVLGYQDVAWELQTLITVEQGSPAADLEAIQGTAPRIEPLEAYC
jgi:hypothetical protein